MYFQTCRVARNLFLGTHYSASSRAFRDQFNINVIMQCGFPTHSHICYGVASIDIPYMTLDSVSSAASMLSVLDKTGSPVLVVDDKAGLQKAATVCAASLVLSHGMCPMGAVTHIQRIKPETFRPEPLYLSLLEQYHRSLHVQHNS